MNVFLVSIGTLLICFGTVMWYNQKNELFDENVVFSVILLLLGVSMVSYTMLKWLNKNEPETITYPKPRKGIIFNCLWINFLIFIGCVLYTIASFYHLKFRHWDFFKVFLLALPLVFVEYQFSIRGNYYASEIIGLNALQITIITMCFCFACSWLLNVFVLKREVVLWREILAAVLLISSVLISNVCC